MTPRTLFLICFTAVIMTASVTFAGSRGGRGGFAGARPTGARPAARFGPTAGMPGTFHRWNGVTSSGQFRNWNGNWNGRRSNWNGNWNGRRSNWNANNWHGNNWHGNNWNGHRHGCNNNVVFYGGGFGYPWYPWYYSYPYYGSYYPYGGYPGAYFDVSYNSTGDPSNYGINYDGSSGEPVYDGNGDNYGSVVAGVQRRLARDGYYHGTIDGVMGSRTYYAIRAYQRDHQLRADGRINQPLLAAMKVR
jgi:hypothetical protein